MCTHTREHPLGAMIACVRCENAHAKNNRTCVQLRPNRWATINISWMGAVRLCIGCRFRPAAHTHPRTVWLVWCKPVTVTGGSSKQIIDSYRLNIVHGTENSHARPGQTWFRLKYTPLSYKERSNINQLHWNAKRAISASARVTHSTNIIAYLLRARGQMLVGFSPLARQS